MVQIPILSGITADGSPDFRTSYPINMRPVPKVQGISQGYLRSNEGATRQNAGNGVTRGGIEWEGACYRVIGERLVLVEADGDIIDLGDVGPGGTCSMTHSFDRLAVTSGGRLFLWDRTNLIEVTDPDLGTALDVVWLSGYFVTTDGENVVVTDLTDPTSVNPLRYGSSEVDPDPVVSVLKLRNELYAINRHSIETFQLVGGTGFPFQVVFGAQIHRGAIGTHCAVVYNESIAFLGSAPNESPGIWLGATGSSQKISTREIDEILQEYTEGQLANAFLEVQTDRSHSILYVHLPNETLCYDASASANLQTPAWYRLSSGPNNTDGYPVRHLVWANNLWMVGNPMGSEVGFLNGDVASVWGETINWQFGTPIIYNESRGSIIHELELVGLSGGAEVGSPSDLWTEYSLGGLTWSQRRYITSGTSGDRAQRMRWMRNGRMTNYRMQRFGGNSDAPIAFARLEAQIEGLRWS